MGVYSFRITDFAFGFAQTGLDWESTAWKSTVWDLGVYSSRAGSLQFGIWESTVLGLPILDLDPHRLACIGSLQFGSLQFGSRQFSENAQFGSLVCGDAGERGRRQPIGWSSQNECAIRSLHQERNHANGLCQLRNCFVHEFPGSKVFNCFVDAVRILPAS